jgi:VanZ family protein
VKSLRLIGLWGPVALFMVLIYGLSGSRALPGVPDMWDKLVHGVAYGFFGILCLRATHGGLSRPRPGPTLAALCLAISYAAFDEWHQAFVPGRCASAGDWVADVLGIGLGYASVLLLTKKGET